MTAAEVPAVVIPDGIEPVEAYRCWTLRGGTLLSLNGWRWTPREPLAAECCTSATSYRWVVCRHGLTAEQAQQTAEEISPIPHPPALALPDGYGFRIEQQTHDSPHEGCTCGIYAVSTQAGVPKGGDVYGKVNMWGKVVPGERGWRAQYAYPSEFHVSAALADDPTLLAFGVPIIVAGGKSANEDENTDWTLLAPDLTFAPRVRRWRLGWLDVAIALNLASAALNLSRAVGIW